MRLHKYILAVGAAVAICTTAIGHPSAKGIPLGERVPSKVAIQWMDVPGCELVLDAIVNDVAKLGLERVSFKDYWNFCLYVSAEVTVDPASGTKWYAISIQPFNRLKFFSACGGKVPFPDHDAFVHHVEIVNEPQSMTIVSEADLQQEIKRVLDRFNTDVFSTVQSYNSGVITYKGGAATK